jgi:lipid-A-disaccharide synthase
MESVAVMGFAEVLTHLPSIRRARGGILRLLRDHPDAIFLPIDSPGLHLGLARSAKRMGRRVVYYVCPQIWAWGHGRVQRLREDVDLTLLLFRFEEELLAKEGVRARWVGHPAGALHPDPALRARAREALDLAPEEVLLALLPGSRRGEVRRLVTPMLDAAARLAAHSRARVRIAVSDAGHLSLALGAGHAKELARTLQPILWTGEAGELLRAADLAVVASGTATLETGALGVPMVIVYRTGWLNYQIARRLVRVPHIGLANLVSGRAGAPELIQNRASGPEIAAALGLLLTDAAAREAQASAFAQLPAILGGEGSAARAADALIAFASASGSA